MANLYVFHQGEENDGQLWYSSSMTQTGAQIRKFRTLVCRAHPRQYSGTVAFLSSTRGPMTTDSFGTRIPRWHKLGRQIR